MVKALVENAQDKNMECFFDDSTKVGSEVPEEDLERTINAKDPEVVISVCVGTNKIRVYKKGS